MTITPDVPTLLDSDTLSRRRTGPLRAHGLSCTALMDIPHPGEWIADWRKPSGSIATFIVDSHGSSIREIELLNSRRSAKERHETDRENEQAKEDKQPHDSSLLRLHQAPLRRCWQSVLSSRACGIPPRLVHGLDRSAEAIRTAASLRTTLLTEITHSWHRRRQVPAGYGLGRAPLLAPPLPSHQMMAAMIEGFLTRHAPRVPQHNSRVARTLPFAASGSVHAVAIAVLLAILSRGTSPAVSHPPAAHETVRIQAPRLVFLSSQSLGRGGGGGGNRQSGPIRRAERPGRDRMTVPIAPPHSTTGQLDTPAPVQQLMLDAKPLASGLVDRIGILEGGVGLGNSLGPGFGGGVGDGIGSGIGSGRGPGFGPGSGGGMGGGAYRPGGPVSAPTVLWQVRPAYTDDALRRKIQGLVTLELVVRSDGYPTDIHVTRSLDPPGLDQEAIRAVQQWRFNPGRLAGTPVDVLVTVELTFSIR